MRVRQASAEEQGRTATRPSCAIAGAILVSLITAASPSLARDSSPAPCRLIDGLPATIDQPGCYRVTRDLAWATSSGNAITVRADHVTLDLTGARIMASRDTATTAIGIYADGRSDLRITGGALVGFFYGVRVDRGRPEAPASRIAIEGVTVSDSTFRGLMVHAKDARITGNVVQRTGGTVVFEDAYAMGIEIFGTGCRIARNVIGETFPVGIGEGVGISLSSDVDDCVVEANRVRNSRHVEQGRTFGLWITRNGGARIGIEANSFANFTYAYWLPRLPGKAWPDNIGARFTGNTAYGIDCGPRELQAFYGGLDASNTFIEGRERCSDTIEARTSSIGRGGSDDPQALFALAQAHYELVTSGTAATTGSASRAEHDVRRRAIPLLERAASLGLAEARRILPRVRAELEAEHRQLDARLIE